MPTIEVQTRVTGGAAPLEPVFLELVEERITARELINRAVREQIHELVTKKRLDAARVQDALARQYLTAEEIAAQADEGRVKMPATPEAAAPRLDEAAQVQRAIRAFEEGRYYIFAGGRQVESLDEELDFSRQAQVTFLRLTPLRGG